MVRQINQIQKENLTTFFLENENVIYIHLPCHDYVI